MSDRGDRLPVILMTAVPVLLMRAGVSFLRFQARRKSSVRRFRRILRANGLSQEDAHRLAQAYHEVGSLRKLLKTGTPQTLARRLRADPRLSL